MKLKCIEALLGEGGMNELGKRTEYGRFTSSRVMLRTFRVVGTC